jgi:alpha-1,3-rhamnosyltransferase
MTSMSNITKLPKLSIILPCYNHEKYIRSCLESIRDQNYENCEVIILNDRSQDGTGDAVRAFLKEVDDARFIYFENEANLGATKNFNKGLSLASGEYLAFIAGDDYWDPSFVRALMERLVVENIDYAFCQTVLVNDSEQELGVIPRNDVGILSPVDIYLNMLKGNIIGGHSIIVKTSFVKNYGYFDETFVYFSDWEFFLRMSKHCKGVFVPARLAYYRIHGNNMALRQFKDDRCLEELKEIIGNYIMSDDLEIPSREKVVLENLLNLSASALYNHNYKLARKILDYSRTRLGMGIFGNPKVASCYVLSLLGNRTVTDIVARQRKKKVGHI